MAFHCQQARVFLVAASLCLLSAFGISAQAQVAAIVTRPSPGPTAGDGRQSEDEILRQRLLMARYSFFIEFVGRENYLVEKGSQGNGAGSVGRTDYGLKLDISEGQEQVMLSILLESSPRVIGLWDQVDAATLSLILSSEVSKIPDDPQLKTFGRELDRLSWETRANLGRELGAEFVRKLDDYVYKVFGSREVPVSSKQDESDVWRDSSTQRQIAPDEPGSIGGDSFSLYFQAMFFAERSPRQGTAEAQGRTGIDKRLMVPANKKEAVAGIIRAVGYQLLETDGREDAAIGAYHRDFGPQPIPRPLPDGLAQTRRQFWATVTDEIARLKQVLSEEDFNRLNEAVIQIFGVRPGNRAQD
jgi:hypothetical protein